MEKDLDSFDPDTIRGHNFQFKLEIPKNLKNWNNEKRRKAMKRLNIKFYELYHLFGGGQGIIFRKKKVHLTNKSIIIYDKASYYAETSKRSQTVAMIKILYLIKALEQRIRGSFSHNGRYKLKPTRQHYALIKNAIAMIYNKPVRKKLEVADDKGFWLLINNSFNLDELECIHPKTSPKDSQGMKNVMNSFKKTDFTVTSEFVLESLNKQNIVMQGIQHNQMQFAEKMVSHIKAVKELGRGVRDFSKAVLHNKEEDRRLNNKNKSCILTTQDCSEKRLIKELEFPLSLVKNYSIKIATLKRAKPMLIC